MATPATRRVLRPSNWAEHMTRREMNRETGQWILICACGYTSDPQPAREMLGWICPQAEREGEK